MDTDQLISQLGSPDIEVGALCFWIHGRQFPTAEDYWDANWVQATVHCGGEGANVWVSGPILHLSELKRWVADCEALHHTLAGRADLKCLEPNLAVQMTMTKTGQIDVQVSITADNVRQAHHFKFTIDQSYLPRLIQGCRAVLEKFPIHEEAHT